jgi:arsenite-transporting ATPase
VPGAPSGLAARELDAPRAFALRRERYRAAVDELFAAVGRGSRWDPAFDRAVVEDLIELAPPGLDELLAILSITEALSPRGSGSGARTIVVDTAPTGHALRLLALPGAALKWAHALLSILLKYRRVVRLGSLGEDLLELSRDLRQLDTLLRDPRRTRVVAVARAAELPRLETLRMVERLKELGIAVGAVIANAVTPPGCGRCRRAAAAEAQEVARLRAACRAGGVRGCGFLLAPAVAPPPRGIHALVGWGQCWSGPCT